MNDLPQSTHQPEHLYIRLSKRRISLARFDAEHHTAFAFTSHKLNPQISLAANLKEVERSEGTIRTPGSGIIQVLVGGPATFVPLAEFQEEDCEKIYNLCFEDKETRRRVFYDVVAQANCVVVFALAEAVCHALEDFGGSVNFISSMTPLLRHFAIRGVNTTDKKRLFVNVHGQTAEIFAFDANRLLLANSFEIHHPADAAYYTLNVARQVGAEVQPGKTDEEGLSTTTTGLSDLSPIYVTGEDTLQKETADELLKYAANIISLAPAAEFNRHPIATTPGVSYDLMTMLLGYRPIN